MRLKNHLNFRGNKKNNEITFHMYGSLNKDMIIEVDDFDKWWEYLELISKQYYEEDVKTWINKYHVNNFELEETNKFLLDNGLVYIDDKLEDFSNLRTANFLNNFLNNSDKDEIIQEMSSKRVLIIGLGTVGTSLVRVLLQLGIVKFDLIEGDIVEEKNIIHQHFYTVEDIGKSKINVIERKINEVKKNIKLNLYNEYFESEKQFDNIDDVNSIDAVFICFDSHDTSVLQTIFDYFNRRKIPVFISGYIFGMVRALEVNQDFLDENREAENNIHKWINENSGLGLLGDLSAILLSRLWLQKLFSLLDFDLKELSYNYLTPSMENDNSFKIKELQTDFDESEKTLNMLKNDDERNYFYNQILFSNALLLYKKFYINSDSNIYDEIIRLNTKFELDLIDEEDKDLNEYEKILSEKYIDCKDTRYSMNEFSIKMLEAKDIDNDCIKKYQENQSELIDLSINALKKKKEMYFDELIKEWDEKRDIKIVLTGIAQEMNNLLYKDDNEVDYEKYKPYSDKFLDVNEALMLISEIDRFNFISDFRGFINYVTTHNMITITENRVNPLCIWNPRYGLSEIIVTYEGSGKDIMDLTHEIGHAYYNSFLNRGNNAKYINSIVSESLAILTEFKLMFILMEQSNLNKSFLNMMIYNLQGTMVGVFSLDLYEEEILKLEDINIENVLEVRNNLIKELFGERVVKNDEYSQLNITLSKDVLFGKRDIYLYPHAKLIGFKFAKLLYKAPAFELNLTNYLKQNDPSQITIENILKSVFQIEVNKEFYKEIGNEMILFLSDIIRKVERD
ncbi:ThiF family adenylyltransferase [Tepidibacillus sp. HK-1]|uniref:ThiF family adenylyltransferase n=1 Tax=Tepidibacillus sp. HK-1 TaxID=1883407 RepID=UPI000853644F|nr:ThiF family adenylyltransferase [Tepidibacillus sp. HK-1]GBF10977.1 thiamine biosynthesis protein ThiF [Tepidibacillus sp. HK-1]